MAMFLLDLYRQHYRPARLVDSAAHTRTRFESDIKRIEKLLGRRATIADLNTTTISRVLADMLESGLARSTVSGFRKKIRALWYFGYVKRLVDDYPELPEIREEHDPPTAWTEDELQRLFRSIGEAKGEICGIPAALFWSSLHRVILDSATRIGAMLQVEWSDVHLDRGTILFRGATQKTRRGQIHPLKPETVAELRLMVEPVRTLVWPLPWSYTMLSYHYKKILERAGLPATHRDMFHKLRRTTATLFAKAGGDASRLLGHTSIKHIERYLDETQIERPSPAKLLPSMGRPISSRATPRTELELLLEDFLRFVAGQDRQGGLATPCARAQLRNGITRFNRLGDFKTVADLTPDAVGRVVQKLADGCAANSMNCYRSRLRRFLRYLADNGHDVGGALAALGERQRGDEPADDEPAEVIFED